MKTRTAAGLASALAVALAALLAGSVTSAGEPRGAAAPATETLATAIFAGGCFWCVETDFDKVEGVVETTSGYTGGTTKNPTYEIVGRGDSGHIEALRVRYDPTKVTYQKLLDYYWRHVDVLDGGGQFCDRGSQYRPAIFVSNEEQKRLAEAGRAAIDKSGRFKQPVAVEILPASEFTPAEEYHQDYHQKNPLKYRYYRYGCGRDARIAELWGNEAGH